MFDKMANSFMRKIGKIFGNKKEKPFSLSDLIHNPEKYVLTSYVENDELVLRIKKKPEKTGKD